MTGMKGFVPTYRHLDPPILAALKRTDSLLSGAFADALSLEEVQADIRRSITFNPTPVRDDLMALEILLTVSLPKYTLLNLVLWSANEPLEQPSDTSAKAWLLGVAHMLRDLLGDQQPPWPDVPFTQEAQTYPNPDPFANRVPVDMHRWFSHATFNHAGTQILALEYNGPVHFWDAHTGEECQTLPPHDHPFTAAALHPTDQELLTTTRAGTVQLWAVSTGQHLRTLTIPLLNRVDQLSSGVFSPDGTRIATTFIDTVHLWDVATGTLQWTLSAHRDCIYTVAFDPAGQRLVTASADGTARIWNARDGREQAVCQSAGGSIPQASFHPDGTQIVTASAIGVVQVWDAQTGQVQLVLPTHQDWVDCTSFSPDGTRLVTAAANGAICLWEAATGQEVLRLRTQCDRVYSAAFSPDGTRLVTAAADGAVRVWDSHTGRQLLLLD